MDRKQMRAFEGFVAESGDTLLRMATLLASDPQTAEDVYQETLQRLAARWPRIDNPKAFSRRVLHNLVIDRARALQRRPRELEFGPAHDSGDARSGDSLAAVELRPALLAALDTLPPQQRAIVVLCATSTTAARPPRLTCSVCPPGRSRARRPGPWPSCAPTQG